MKKFLILMLVLGLASAANANLLISVDGVVDPPDTEIILTPSQEMIIDIHGMGNQTGENFMGWLLIQGCGAIDASSPTYLWEQSTAQRLPGLDDIWIPEEHPFFILAELGYPGVVDIIEWEIKDLTEPYGAPNGLLIDGLIFHCEGIDDPLFGSDVILTLLDIEELNVFDTQIIHQIPEPATICLLALGGLALGRKRRA